MDSPPPPPFAAADKVTSFRRTLVTLERHSGPHSVLLGVDSRTLGGDRGRTAPVEFNKRLRYSSRRTARSATTPFRWKPVTQHFNSVSCTLSIRVVSLWLLYQGVPEDRVYLRPSSCLKLFYFAGKC